jgi:hypothetical protein
MSGLLPRIRRRRSPAPPIAPEPRRPTEADPTEPATEVLHAPAPQSQPFERPGFRARGQLRRRLRYLRRMRELGLRDVGGLVFDLDRFGRSRDDLVREKLVALAAIDAELSAVGGALDQDASFAELREIGIAPCPACAALLPSDARFCSACGVRVDRGEATVATAFATAAPLDDDAPSGADAGT